MILFHTIAGLLALLSGTAVVLLVKGDGRHKLIGRIYVISMYALCLTSFAVPGTITYLPYYRGFGIFHFIALVGTLYLTVGIIPLLLRRRLRDWFAVHFYCMLWSYVGLIMALNAHFFPQVLRFLAADLAFSRRAASLTAMFVLWGVPLVVGNVLINRKMKDYKRRFGLLNIPQPRPLNAG